MELTDASWVHGLLTDDSGAAGLVGYQVEVWHPASSVSSPVASAKSDASGHFAIGYPPASGAMQGLGEAELRVTDTEGRVVHSEPFTHEDRVPPQRREVRVSFAGPGAADSRSQGAVNVSGWIEGELGDGFRVRAVARRVESNGIRHTALAECFPGADGWYRFGSVPLPSEREARSGVLVVQLVDTRGRVLSEASAMLPAPNDDLVLDLRAPSAGLVSEYARMERAAVERIGANTEVLGELSDDALGEVSTWLDADPERVRLLGRALRLEGETSLPGAAFYALGRSGLPMSPQELLDVSASELRHTLRGAIDAGYVGAEHLEQLDSVVDGLCQEAVDRTLQQRVDDLEPGFGATLAQLKLAPAKLREILRRYQHRQPQVGPSGSVQPEGLGWGESEEDLEPEAAAEVALCSELVSVLGDDPALVCELQARRERGEWRRVQDLTDFDFDDWCDLVERVLSGENSTHSETIEDRDARSDQAEAWAGSIVDALELAYPSEYIRRELGRTELLSAPAKRLLEGATDHDFVNSSIRARVESESLLVEGLEPGEAERAIAELETIERLSRVSPRATEIAVLMEGGLDSAHSIAAIPRRSFIEAFAEALGGRAQASRLHAEAQQNAAANQLALVGALQAQQPVPFVLGGSPPDSLQANLPSLRSLIGSGALCDCPQCGSVYGPAAYLVDLLRYLGDTARLREALARVRVPTSEAERQAFARRTQHSPLDVLLARRPDIADIPLTCENAFTPLPYIDLVNEVLESRVAGRPWNPDTGKVPADVLRAIPQNLNRDAYGVLEQEVYPITLPFHEPLAVFRAYLGHFGVSRLDILRAFSRSTADNEAMTAEALGMSPQEYALVAAAPTDIWRHFGLPAERDAASVADSLAPAPAFLKATGLSFQDLVELVSMRFTSPNGALSLDTPVLDCNPANVRIGGLDGASLARILQVVRLRARLGWSFTDLDRALTAVRAGELDAAVLAKLVEIQLIAKRLERPVAELLVLWAPLDTQGKDNPFERLLCTRAVAWHAGQAPFRLKPDGSELITTGENLEEVAPALLAAFRITSDELAVAVTMQTRRGTVPSLSLAGLSAVYRVVLLARATRLSLRQLEGLLRLVASDAYPFTPSEPAATRRFIDVVEQVQSSEFSCERLMYLFLHETLPRHDPSPRTEQVSAVLSSIQRGLVDAFAETAQPGAILGDTLRQKLALWLDATLLDTALEVLDPRARTPSKRRQEFFQRHLARIFPDPQSAARQLFDVADDSAVQAAAAPPTAPTPEPTAASPGLEAVDSRTPTARPASSVTASTRGALDRRAESNVRYVLDHLMPLLRARQLRGAVIQVLSDSLGLSSATTARLIENVLHSSRNPGEPMMADYAALLGTGLSAAYFNNPSLEGEPAATRIEPEITFSWGGGPPAPGIRPQGFSARFSGRFCPKGKSDHTFYLVTEGAVRLIVTVNGAERALITQQEGSAVPVELVSDPVPLDSGKLYELRIEYRNQGAPASLSFHFGTSPRSKQLVPTTHLYPLDGLSSFAPLEQSYRRIHKAALLLTGFGATDTHVEWLTGNRRLLDLDALPMTQPKDIEARTHFQRWRYLAALYALRKQHTATGSDLFDVFRAPTPEEASRRLLATTGWDAAVVAGLLSPQGFGDAAKSGLLGHDEPLLVRLARAVEVQRRVGVAPATLFSWVKDAPSAETAAEVVQAVKARYDQKRWLEVARGLNDSLRAARREALVQYLLPRLEEKGVKSRNQLFEYFLLDVDMSPCMLTSRIRQAIGSAQTFIQRCLMSLEVVHPRSIDDSDWKWMKNYRVWEANRKVFLYPENWIEPELRDDKSPLFQAFERTILQNEIKKENVEAAFADYLEGLDEVARLDIRAVHFERRNRAGSARRQQTPFQAPLQSNEWDIGTYHVFGRTFSPPHVWYQRRLERGRHWTPWEKVDADIEGEHLVPVIVQGRMHLFWAIFREVTRKAPQQKREEKGPIMALGKDWEVQLAYTVHDRGRWSRKCLSEGGILDGCSMLVSEQTRDGAEQSMLGSAVFPHSVYTLRAEPSGAASIRIHLYRRHTHALEHSASDPAAIAGTLDPSGMMRLGEFTLDGCNGALRPSLSPLAAAWMSRASDYVGWKRLAASRAIGDRLRSLRMEVEVGGVPVQVPFATERGGRLACPAGYAVSAQGFERSGGKLRPLLTLPSGAQGGHQPVLGAETQDRTLLLPVVDGIMLGGQLMPFILQTGLRCFFALPVDSTQFELRPQVLPRSGGFLSFGRRQPASARRRRFGRGRREDSEPIEAAAVSGSCQCASGETRAPETPDELDAWEDAEDEAWHPDDAAERLPRRRRSRKSVARSTARAAKPVQSAPVKPAPPVAPATFSQRFRFVAFEHPHTCSLIHRLRQDGIDALLQLTVTEPTDRGKAFGNYGPTSLVDSARPHLDIDFELGSPYGTYNWELFFHAPLLIAVRLAKEGRHEEAQRWFHYIFDPTTDVSDPSPSRYWRFKPLHQQSVQLGARQIVELLSGTGGDGQSPDAVRAASAQLTAWLENPFSPHVLARLRPAAYQKAVVMKYIDNLIEWGDKLFRQDTMESVNEATQLYILAGNILGPRPERIPPLVEVPPTTFRQIRSKANAFSNWMVRFETSQVRRPFRISARLEVGAVTNALRLETEYFCVPHNPQLERYWDTVADRLYKIRNCMNIQGVVRQMPLFEPPIEPGMLARAAAAGIDLGSVLSSLNAPPPHHRFGHLFARALRMAEELRSFGKMTLEVLERRDAEGLAALRASHEVALLQAARDVRKKHVKEVEEELSELSLQKEQIELKLQYLGGQVRELMNPQEAASQAAMVMAKVYSGVVEGIELVSKVLYAIPEIQGGAAGISSPFATFQIGGQMFGCISSAFAEAVSKLSERSEAEAALAEAQAEFQRRRAEWQQEIDVLTKERGQLDKQIARVQLRFEIASAELRQHDLAVRNSEMVQAYLREKYTNEELYAWMLGQLSSVHFQVYRFAFDAAQQVQRAFQFERADNTASFIEFAYWDSLKRGLFAGERLLLDLRRLEAAHLDGDRRGLEITRHISLRSDFPIALEELLARGRCQIDVTESLLDGDFPGHYFRRIKTVALSVPGVRKPLTNVNGTLTLLQNRIRKDPNASGNYAPSEDSDDSRFAFNLTPVQVVSTSRPSDDHGLLQLRFDDARYLPFEGAGAISSWRIDLHQSDNALALEDAADVVLSLSYTARSGGAPLEAAARANRETALSRGGLKPQPIHAVSIRRDLPGYWKQLAEAQAGQEIETKLQLGPEHLPARYQDYSVRIERVIVIARCRGRVAPDSLHLRIEPPTGGGTTVAGWAEPWPEAKAFRGVAEVSGPAGEWKVAVSVAGSRVPQALKDVVLCFELRAKRP